jgi:hypothetical protein
MDVMSAPGGSSPAPMTNSRVLRVVNLASLNLKYYLPRFPFI